MPNTPTITHGLNVVPRDPRNFTLGALFQLPKLSELPESFTLEGFRVKNQGQTDLCSAYASTGVSELQEDVELDPNWSFAASKFLSGNVDAWGQNLPDAMKAHVKYGAVEGSTPYDESKRHIENWSPSLFEQAKKHKKQTYIEVSPSQNYDAFDTIRATLWKFRDEKRGIVSGVDWGWSIFDVYLKDVRSGPGHAIRYVGWRGDYLTLVGSNGTDAGDHGVHYVHRDVVNTFVAKYQAFMFVDMPREQVEYMLDNGIKHGDNWVVQLLKALKTIVVSPFLTLQEKTDIIRMTNETIKTVTTEVEPRIKLRDWALAHVGQDVSPEDIAPDERSCAESMCHGIRESGVAPDFPILPYTPDLKKALLKDQRFVATLTPIEGAMALAASEGDSIGHVGTIVKVVLLANGDVDADNTLIVSTGGKDGTLKQNFTFASFVRFYRTSRGSKGLRINLFVPTTPATTGAIDMPQEDLPFSREQVLRVVQSLFALALMFGANPEAHGITAEQVTGTAMLVLALWGWVMRYRKGDVTLAGFRKL